MIATFQDVSCDMGSVPTGGFCLDPCFLCEAGRQVSVTGVVARATQDQPAFTFRKFGYGAFKNCTRRTGHEFNSGDSSLANRDRIKAAHLLGGIQFWHSLNHASIIV